MAAFDIFAALVTTSEGREKALTAVRKASGDKQIAHMVVGICHSVHGLSGKIDDSEHAEIELIAEALGVSARPDEISAMITEANLHA
jgi:tellurite resistance protein